MRTFYHVDDDLLIIEVIRRLRLRNALGGGRTAPEGTDFGKLLQALVDSGIFAPKELHKKLAALLQSKDILLTGRASFREVGQRQSTRKLKKGLIGRLNPDATFAAIQYFTENGTPITSRYDKKSGRLLYPGERVSYWSLTLDRIYVVSDNLPKSVNHNLTPVEPY